MRQSNFGDQAKAVAKSRYIWLWGMAGALGIALAAFRSDDEQSVSLPAPSQDVLQTHSALHVFDKSQIGPELLLFSKTSTGDLWFRDAMGRERCLASNVVRASFSPDGKKFAYGTSDNEVFILNVDGNQLARLIRASDHVWSANSAAVSFSATASLDYPELEQAVVYHLTTNSAPPRPGEEGDN